MVNLQRSLLVALSLSLAAAPGLLAGTLTVRPGVPNNGGSARFSGTEGLEVDVANPNRNPAFVQSSQPSAEATYRVRFYANLRTLTMTDGDQFDLFVAYDGADPVPPTITGNAVLRLAVGQAGGVKQLTAFARLNGGTEAQSPTPMALPNGWRSIEINWAKATASGANNGRLDLWLDGRAQTGLTGLNNDTMTINYARWGAVAGPDAGTSGTFRLDDFASQRSGYIGPAFPFSDNPTSSPFFPFIQGIYAAEVIPECAIGSFCPNNAITRKEMAKFLLLAKFGASFTPPACTVPMFSDVPCSHPYATWINEIAREGITSGCSPGLYCPDGNITRSQMAVFLMVANGVTPGGCPPSTFSDVPASSPFCPWINAIAARGITAGCGAGTFCPESLVLRGQMAVFLSATFNLPTHVVGP
jgi:hypothetical protein